MADVYLLPVDHDPFKPGIQGEDEEARAFADRPPVPMTSSSLAHYRGVGSDYAADRSPRAPAEILAGIPFANALTGVTLAAGSLPRLARSMISEGINTADRWLSATRQFPGAKATDDLVYPTGKPDLMEINPNRLEQHDVLAPLGLAGMGSPVSALGRETLRGGAKVGRPSESYSPSLGDRAVGKYMDLRGEFDHRYEEPTTPRAWAIERKPGVQDANHPLPTNPQKLYRMWDTEEVRLVTGARMQLHDYDGKIPVERLPDELRKAAQSGLRSDAGNLNELARHLESVAENKAIALEVDSAHPVMRGSANEPGDPSDRFRLLADQQRSSLPGMIQAAVENASRSEKVSPARIENPIRVYHGSPHDFDKFDSKHIGSGEGAQAFGHGLYFAESSGVAKSYQKTPFDHNSPQSVANGYFKDAGGNAEKALSAIAKDRAVFGADYARTLDQAADLIKAGKGAEGPGRLYEVSLHAHPDQFLDWDLPLSKQSEGVAASMAKIFGENFENLVSQKSQGKPLDRLVGRLRGQPPPADHLTMGGYRELLNLGKGLPLPTGKELPAEIFDRIRKPEALSKALREAGVVGIRYKDQGSRGKEGGTYNYVVFPGADDVIEIIGKDGKPLQGAEKAKAVKDLYARQGLPVPGEDNTLDEDAVRSSYSDYDLGYARQPIDPDYQEWRQRAVDERYAEDLKTVEVARAMHALADYRPGKRLSTNVEDRRLASEQENARLQALVDEMPDKEPSYAKNYGPLPGPRRIYLVPVDHNPFKKKGRQVTRRAF